MFFTIVVATYNRADILPMCLDRIRAQDFGDYEVIILDDCSPDNTTEVVQEYLKDPRFKYHRLEKNLGHGERVFRYGEQLKLYKGDWIIFDCDDELIIGNNALSNLKAFIDKNPHLDGISPNYTHMHFGEIAFKMRELGHFYPIIFRNDFYYEIDLFNTEKFGIEAGGIYEVPVGYLKAHHKFEICQDFCVSNGVYPVARAKYMDLYNLIVGQGMYFAYGVEDVAKACESFGNYISEDSMCHEALMDLHLRDLAKAISRFFNHPDYLTMLKRFGRIYRDTFQEELNAKYREFNGSLMTLKERQEAVKNAKNIAIYGAGFFGAQVREYLEKLGKSVSVFDDNSAQNASVLVRKSSEFDLIFIATTGIKNIIKMRENIRAANLPIATIVLQHEGWQPVVIKGY